MKYWKTFVLCVVFAASGGFFGYWYAFEKNDDVLSQIRQIRETNSSYQLIQPLLAVDFTDSITFREYTDLEDKIQNKITDLVAQNRVKSVSVYFRDLRNGHWVGINENDNFAPASLLKLPVLIAYFKQAEIEPEILQKKFLYLPDDFPDELENQEEHVLNPGQEYTIEELLEDMIVYSDNISFALLLRNIDQDVLQEVFTDLGIQFPGDDGKNQYFISAKTYSLFFRILRNATLLNRDKSEAALKLLTQTSFHDGLVAGVPAGVPVAHKFGIYRLDPEIGLHDCGIIYQPQSPYVLCVMTKGDNLDNLENTIREISGLVYTEIK